MSSSGIVLKFNSFAIMFLFCILSRTARCTHGFRQTLLSAGQCPGSLTFTRFQSHRQCPFFLTRYSSTLGSSSARYSTHSASILHGLNDAQVDAVTQPLSSITRVVAGPGAGKTRVLTCRIAHLLYEDPNNKVLAVTFTKKAAGEMQHRLQKILEDAGAAMSKNGMVGELSEDDQWNKLLLEEHVGEQQVRHLDRVTLGTFHSVCAKILRWNGKKLESLPTIRGEMIGPIHLDGSFAIVDQSEQLRIVKSCLDELKINLKDEKDMKVMTILTAVGKIKELHAINERFDDKDLANRGNRIAQEIYPMYRRKLFSSNAMDFDDLIYFTKELLDVHVDIRSALQQRWHHVLVDEFQDTSKVQLDLVRLLTRDSLLVVGDADQSIYSWRGAAVESMSDFEKEFKKYHASGVKTVYLMENYRSTTNIVNAAQKIISFESSKGTMPSKNKGMRQDMKPMRGTGASPRVLACADGKTEANFVVHTIQEMIASGEYTPDHSIAIIYRTNLQSRAIEEACVKNSLPYVVRGSAGTFYSRQEIKDCLCFLRWIYNGQDQAAMTRAFKTPSKGIGEKTLDEFIKYCSTIEEHYISKHPELPTPTPLDVLFSITDGFGVGELSGIVADIPPIALSNRFLNKFILFSKQMRTIKNNAYSQSVSDLIFSTIEVMDLEAHFNSISKTTAEFGDRWGNVQELRQAAVKYASGGPALKSVSGSAPTDDVESPLGNFLDDVALVADLGDDSDGDGEEKRLKANLMTIHASKGMEFDAVFIIGNEDGTLPSQHAILEGEGSVELDEERRLCYVAMTRAKNNLVMTWRREVSIFVGSDLRTIQKDRSRFLNVLVGEKIFSSSRTAKHEGTHSRNFSTNGLSPLKPSHQSTPLRSSSFQTQSPKSKVTGTRGISSLQSASPNTSSKEAVARSQRSSNLVPSAELKKGKVVIKAYLPTKIAPMPSSSNAVPSATHIDPTKKSQGPRERRANMDSTWFYPVGSSVRHKQLGEGKVLNPPPDQDGEMMVKVQFHSGRVEDIPAMGPDLFPF